MNHDGELMEHKGKVTQRDLYEDIEQVRKDIGELKQIVHDIKATKQDKVRANIVIPFILYLLSQTMVGVWWAADISSSMTQVSKSIEATGKDRFYGRDGEALTRYMETRLAGLERRSDNLDEDVERINSRDKQIEQAHADLRERISKLEIKQ